MNRISKQIMAVYNAIANDYDKELWSDTQYAEHIDAFLKLVKGNKIIDIGCAMGSFTKYVADKGYETTGLDISDNMIKIARRKVKNVKFIKADMLDFKSTKKYDGLMSINSIIHIEKSEMPSVLNNFKELLTDDGVMLIILQEGEGERYVVEPLNTRITEFVNLYKDKEIEKLFKQLNLKIVYKQKVVDQTEAALENSQFVYILKK